MRRMNGTRFLMLTAVVVATVAGRPSRAGVLNGDFSAGTNNWAIVFNPGNTQPPDYTVLPFDIDGPGPLGTSSVFRVGVGDDALMNIEQPVNLMAGGIYRFHADLAMTTPGNNGDGGTIAAYVGSTLLASYSFGSTTVGVNQYTNISTTFSPGTTGTQTLSIHFSRGYGYGPASTPKDYIDNISLSPPLISLNVQRAGGQVVLSWTNLAYALQAAPAVSGTYTNVPAGSPYTNNLADPARFFRLIAN